MRKYTILGGYGLLALVLDQLTKWWAVAAIDPLQPVTVIPGLLDLVLVHNRGAAFGFLNRSDIQWQFWLFLGATVVAAVAIVALLRSSRFNAWLSAGLGLVLGGALGNLVDRIRFRAVIDFVDVYVGQWHWPAFNVADMAICVGAFLACIVIWRTPEARKRARRKNHDLCLVARPGGPDPHPAQPLEHLAYLEPPLLILPAKGHLAGHRCFPACAGGPDLYFRRSQARR